MVRSSVRLSTVILTKDQLAAIGSLAIESTYCEQWVENLIWFLCKLEEPQGKQFTQNIQMKSRLELLCNLGKPLLASESEKTEFVSLISQLKEANNDRNTIIHGSWGTATKNLLTVMREGPENHSPAIVTKRRPNKPPITMQATDIEKAAVRIADLTGQLIQFAAHNPSWRKLLS
ncbi:MAG: hypothetical protein ACREXN_02745 [Polaromonas sp.]